MSTALKVEMMAIISQMYPTETTESEDEAEEIEQLEKLQRPVGIALLSLWITTAVMAIGRSEVVLPSIWKHQ
jgi:hypothetical protein